MMQSRRGFSVILIGIIAAVALVGIVGANLFLTKKSSVPPAQPGQQTANQTSEGSQSLATTTTSPVAETTPPPAAFPTTPPSIKLSALFTGDSAVGKAVNLDAVATAYGLHLSQAQADYLEKNKFLLLPLNEADDYSFDSMLAYFDQIGGIYAKHYRAPQNTKFITPDIVLHAYHKYFDLSLSELEQTELSPTLSKFLTEVMSNTAQVSAQATPDIAARYQNILAQLTVARVLLENQSASQPDYFTATESQDTWLTKDQAIDSFDNAEKILAKYSSGLTPDLANKALAELKLIYDASGLGISPLWSQYKPDLQTDYTQFTPRSHYTKNSALRAYFRAMMYLGRNSYFFASDLGIKDANLLAGLFTVKSSDGSAPLASWQRITNITNFYVGQPDDITYAEYQVFLNATVGNNLAPQNLVSDATLDTIKSNLGQLQPPKIFSDVVVNPAVPSMTKADLLKSSLAFRIFGQKFTFDAWVLNDLTAGDELTPVKLPSMPTALFIPAAFSDARAREDVSQFLSKEDNYTQADISGFMSKLDEKMGQLKKIKPDEWQSALGSAWLDLLSTLTGSYGSTYPLYMQSPNFPDKQIQTFLGSYTELKHDTLLYAKQSYAERGGGGEEPPPLPPVVKGFVEPNVAFWKKLEGLIDRTKQFFNQYGVFQNSAVLSRLDEFKGDVSFYESIAEKEMHGTPVTEDEYEKLRTTGLSFMAHPFGGEDIPDKDSGKPALIADVHTDGKSGQILYEADGQPYIMLAYVGNESSPRVVIGLAYNHYEFAQPIGKRLTDEGWRGWVYNATSSLPAKNFWYQSLIVH